MSEDDRKVKHMTLKLKNDEKHFSLNEKEDAEIRHPSYLNPPSEYVGQENGNPKVSD